MRALLFALLFNAPFDCTSFVPTTGNAARRPAQAQTQPAQTQTADHAFKLAREADDRASDAELERAAAKAMAAAKQAEREAVALAALQGATPRLQEDFDASDRRFNGLLELAVKVPGSRGDLDDAAAEVRAREATVMRAIARLREATYAEWDPAKQQVDAALVAHTKAIDAFEVILEMRTHPVSAGL